MNELMLVVDTYRDRMVCPICKSPLIKHGVRNGVQIFKCKRYGYSFTSGLKDDAKTRYLHNRHLN